MNRKGYPVPAKSGGLSSSDVVNNIHGNYTIASEVGMKQLSWDTLLYGRVISSVLAPRQAGNVANGAIFEKRPPPAVGLQRLGHQLWPTSPQCITKYPVQRRK